MVSGNAFGSTYDITYLGEEIPDLAQRIDSFVLSFNASLSTYDSTSLLSRINRNTAYEMDELVKTTIAKGLLISDRCSGAFDMTIGPLSEAWGFGLKHAENMDSTRVNEIMRSVGYRKVWMDGNSLSKLDSGLRFDVNGIAPGLASDMISSMLNAWGYHNFYVNVGGEIFCQGKNVDSVDWRIAVEQPIENKTSTNAAQRTIGISDQAIATSGNYRKFYVKDGKKYAHTIDPRTGYPIQHTLLSATIVGPECVTADALATACMVMGRGEAKVMLEQQFPDYAYFFIYDDGNGGFMEEWSPSLKEKLQ